MWGAQEQVQVIILKTSKSARWSALFFLCVNVLLLFGWQFEAAGWKKLALILAPILGVLMLPAVPFMLKLLIHRGSAGIMLPTAVILTCLPFGTAVIEDDNFREDFDSWFKNDGDALILALRIDNADKLHPYHRFIGGLLARLNPERRVIVGPFQHEAADTLANLPPALKATAERAIARAAEAKAAARKEEYDAKLSRVMGRMMDRLNDRLAMPKSREEADRRFKDAPIGYWGDSRFSVAPTDKSMGFLASGAGYADYHHPFEIEETLFRWRPVSPGKLEVTLEGEDNWKPLDFEVTGPNEEGEFFLKFETDLDEIGYFGHADMHYGGLLGADEE